MGNPSLMWGYKESFEMNRAGSQCSFCCLAAAASRPSLLHFCPCLQRPLPQNKNCINELFSLRKTLSGKAEYKEYLLIPCYVIFFSSSWFYKTIGPRPEPLIPGRERNILTASSPQNLGGGNGKREAWGTIIPLWLSDGENGRTWMSLGARTLDSLYSSAIQCKKEFWM